MAKPKGAILNTRIDLMSSGQNSFQSTFDNQSSAPSFGGAAPSFGGAAPSFGGAAPSFGGAAPSFGGAAPSFGASQPSPSFGGAAPSFGGAAPSFGGAAPSFGGAAPSFGASQPSPSFGGAAPSFGGSAPSFGGAAPSFGASQPSPSFGGAAPSFGGAAPSFGGAAPSAGFGTFAAPPVQQISIKKHIEDDALELMISTALHAGAEGIIEWLRNRQSQSPPTVEELKNALPNIRSVRQEGTTSTGGSGGKTKSEKADLTTEDIRILSTWILPGFKDGWSVDTCQYYVKSSNNYDTCYKYCENPKFPLCDKHNKNPNAACKALLQGIASAQNRHQYAFMKHREAVAERIKKASSKLQVPAPNIDDVMYTSPGGPPYVGNLGNFPRSHDDKMWYIHNGELKGSIVIKRKDDRVPTVIGLAHGPGEPLIAVSQEELDARTKYLQNEIGKVTEIKARIQNIIDQSISSKNMNAPRAFEFFPSNQVQGNGSTGFGATPNFGSGGFGPSTNGFGPSTNGSQPPSFGSQPAPPNFGSQPAPPSFGSQQQPAPSFGSQQQPAPSFGSQPAPSFGSQQQQAPPSFGSQQQPAPSFGSQPAPSFSQQQQPAPSFGSQPAPSFSQQQQPAPSFGSQPAPSFGSSFGSQPAPSFSQQQQAPPSFSQQQQPAPSFSQQQQPAPPSFGSQQQPAPPSFSQQQQPAPPSFGSQQQPAPPSFGSQQQPAPPSFGSQQQPEQQQPEQQPAPSSFSSQQQVEQPTSNLSQQQQAEQQPIPPSFSSQQNATLGSPTPQDITPSAVITETSGIPQQVTDSIKLVQGETTNSPSTPFGQPLVSTSQ